MSVVTKVTILTALVVIVGTGGANAAPRTSTSSIRPSIAETAFTFEKVFLTEDDIRQFPELQFDDTVYPETVDIDRQVLSAKLERRSKKQQCKTIPSDRKWPDAKAWNNLKKSAHGQLTKTIPLASVCYEGPSMDSTKCKEITDRWADSDLHDADPASIMSPWMQGASCLPPTMAAPNATCSLGGYPNYVLTAKSVSDVQLALNFARNHNIRLVIKNTGHDFSGKSSGANSLSIRTHLFKDIEYIPKYSGPGYKGKAFKVGAGVQVFEIYKAAYAKGLMVVGGEGMTVGYGGGYLQGGGHSPLSSILGMGADHILALQVVTADGRFVTADPETNSDLYWALRGGGGSTFGVVTSVTVKAHEDVPVTTVSFSFAVGGSVTKEKFWDAIKAYFKTFPDMVDKGVYSYFNIMGGASFGMMPALFAPKLKAAEVNELLAPFYNKLNELGIPFTPNTTEYNSFYPAWKENFPKEAIGGTDVQTSSRLFPRANFECEETFEATFSAIREVVEKTGFFLAFNIAPTLKAGGYPDNAVSPHWRKTVLHAITGVFWGPTATKAEIQATRDGLTYGLMQKWRDVSPNSGVYMNECDIREPNFQQAMYGENYPKLYKIKQKYDPKGVFYAATAVGSEDWVLDDEGRLCHL